MDSEREQTRTAQRIPWRRICLTVGLMVGMVFLWDIISHPVHYFGFDPTPGIINALNLVLRIMVGATVLVFILYVVEKNSSNVGMEAGKRDFESARQTTSVQGLSAQPQKPSRWSDDYPCDVVGESHYQETLDEICGGKDFDGHCEEVTASLVLDDENTYDSQAVRVEIEGETVGYLSRENARKFRKRYAKKKQLVQCCAVILGGWDRGEGDVGHYGVKLDLKL